jgi:hypothetical protein
MSGQPTLDHVRNTSHLKGRQLLPVTASSNFYPGAAVPQPFREPCRTRPPASRYGQPWHSLGHTEPEVGNRLKEISRLPRYDIRIANPNSHPLGQPLAVTRYDIFDLSLWSKFILPFIVPSRS